MAPAQKEEGDWKRYSFLDNIWVGCLDAFRNLGVPIEILKKARHSLADTDILPESEYPALEFYLDRYVLFREKYYLLVFGDGTAFPLSLGEFISYLQIHGYENYDFVAVDLSQIFFEMFLSNHDHDSKKPILPPAVKYLGGQHYAAVNMEDLVSKLYMQDKSVRKMTTTKRGNEERTVEGWELEKVFAKNEASLHELKSEKGVVDVQPIVKNKHTIGYTQRKKIKNLPKIRGKHGLKSHPE